MCWIIEPSVCRAMSKLAYPYRSGEGPEDAGSRSYKPSTSLISLQRSASNACERKIAVISDPPRPSVTACPSPSIATNPGKTTTPLVSRDAMILSLQTDTRFASSGFPSATRSTPAGVRTLAGMPARSRWIPSMDADSNSPSEISADLARSEALSHSESHRLMSSSVRPASAETTAITRYPSRRHR